MKKIILALMMILVLTGCTTVQKKDIPELISYGVENESTLTNEYRSGYKYYLPKGLRIINKRDYNERIKSGDYSYYLYVDVVSYYNKVIENYETKENVYFSDVINYQDKFGYLEIKNIKENKYLIEIMYNYAKIEVIVRKNDINVAVSNSIRILSSIKYNDEILKNLIGEDTDSFNELEYNIFTTTNDSSYLQFVTKEEENASDEKEYDSDLVN